MLGLPSELCSYIYTYSILLYRLYSGCICKRWTIHCCWGKPCILAKNRGHSSFLKLSHTLRSLGDFIHAFWCSSRFFDAVQRILTHFFTHFFAFGNAWVNGKIPTLDTQSGDISKFLKLHIFWLGMLLTLQDSLFQSCHATAVWTDTSISDRQVDHAGNPCVFTNVSAAHISTS